MTFTIRRVLSGRRTSSKGTSGRRTSSKCTSGRRTSSKGTSGTRTKTVAPQGTLTARKGSLTSSLRYLVLIKGKLYIQSIAAYINQ